MINPYEHDEDAPGCYDCDEPCSGELVRHGKVYCPTCYWADQPAQVGEEDDQDVDEAREDEAWAKSSH